MIFFSARRPRTLTLPALLTPLITALALPAPAAEREIVPQLCAKRTAEGAEITLSTGCQSSSFQRQPGDPTVEVVENRAAILVDGSFRYEVPENGIALTDCGGAASVTVQLPGLDRRIFNVGHESGPIGRLDLRETNEACAMPASGPLGFVPERDAGAWRAIDEADWGQRTARAPMGLMPPLTANFPETIEGYPTLQIHLGRSPVPGPKSARIEIHLEVGGVLDDAIRSIRWIGLASPHFEGWVLDGLWTQELCARGEMAGKWTAGPCP